MQVLGGEPKSFICDECDQTRFIGVQFKTDDEWDSTNVCAGCLGKAFAEIGPEQFPRKALLVALIIANMNVLHSVLNDEKTMQNQMLQGKMMALKQMLERLSV